MARLPGQCIFCGGRGLTKEHLFSDWLREFFPQNDHQTHTFGVVEFHPTRSVTQRVRPGHSGSKKVRKICAVCNSGWISGIDDAARLVLSPIIRGESRTVVSSMQAATAAWVAKIAMVGDSMNRAKSKVTQTERDWIRFNRQPPAHWEAWIGTYDGSEWRDLGIYQHGGHLKAPPIPSPRPFSGYVEATTIGIGPILLLTIATDISAIGFEVGDIKTDMRRIWPVTDDFVWPIPSAISDEKAGSIAGVLERMLMRPLGGDPSMTPTQGAPTTKK